MKKILKFKNSKIIINCLVTILLLGGLLTGYWSIKKEDVSLIVRGEGKSVNSFAKNVEDLLKENNVTYDENDIIEPSLDTKLQDNMKVNVTYVDVVTVSEHERIDYETKIKEDSNLEKGVTKVIQEGKQGRKVTIYEEVYHNNKLVSKVVEEEIIREKPVAKIITKGTNTSNYAKVSLKNSDKLKGTTSYKLSGSNYSSSGKKLAVSATAYSGGGITATGTRARWGVIAVDPRVIPYGTKVYIPQFNMTFTAEDCGGGIKGNKIDIYMNSDSSCYNWGKRSIDIYIVG